MSAPTMSQFATELDCLRARDKFFQQENADLRAQLADKVAVEEMRDKEIAWLREAHGDAIGERDALHQRIEEAEKQEPVGEVTVIDKHDQSYCMSALGKLPFGTKLYTRPIPPADVAELQRKYDESVNAQNELHEQIYGHQQHLAELERKLAEQQAINVRLQAMTGSIVNPHEELNKLLSEAREEGRKEAVQDWVEVKDIFLPPSGRKVLAFDGKRVIRAQWVAKFSCDNVSDEGDFYDYRESDDTYWLPEGWYECVSHWEDYNMAFVNQKITHWRPLPATPSPALNAKEGGE